MNKYIKLGIVCGIALVVLGAALFFMSGTTSVGNLPSGTFVRSTDLSGMTREEAIAALKNVNLNPAATATIEVNGDNISFAAADVGAYHNAEKTVNNILSSKRNFFEKIFRVKKVYDMAIDMDDEKLNGAIEERLSGKERAPLDLSYEVTEGGISVTNPVSGRRLSREKAKTVLSEAFASPKSTAIKMELEIIPAPAVDSDMFLANFGAEPAEAKYVRNADGTISVTEGIVGITIDKAAAKSVMDSHKSEGEKFTLKADVTRPSHTKEELEAALFADEMAAYSSSYASSGANRASNVALAASKINGTVLMPGEVFSFNNALGERTVENGYKSAHAYAAGEVVDQVGGGICQVSSTLYNSVLLSNLQINERRSHQMTVGYVPLGRDATVNWGTQDFKFTNNTVYPIKITATASGGTLTVGVVGTKTDKTMKVEIETTTISTLEPQVKEEEDPQMEIGTSKTVKTGSRGYVVDAYRVVYSNGAEISREKLKRSSYNPTQTVRRVGTKAPRTESAKETPTA